METGKRKRRGVLWVFLILLVGVAVLVGVIVTVFSGPSVPRRAILHLRLGSDLVQRPAEGMEKLVLGSRSPAVCDLHRSLLHAASDKRVKGLLVDLQSGSLGFSEAKELRGLILSFRKHGKETIAYGDDISFRAWYVASACDRIAINPRGYLRLTGMGVKVVLFGGLLKKMKLHADFERIGRYKTAYETLTSSELGVESREALNRLIESSWAEVLSDLAASRDIGKDKLEAIIDRGPVPAEEAKACKLVDRVVWKSRLKEELRNAQDKEAEFFSWRLYADSTRKRASGKKIAYFPLSGSIVGGKDLGPGTVGAGAVVKHLNELKDDKEIEAIVLRVDSPGGDALASARLYHAVSAVRKKKPVVVSMGSRAASGGYYFSSAADHIVAHPFTLTGSIGIFGGKIVAGELAGWAGVAHEDFRRGEFSGMYDPWRPFDEKDREALRAELSHIYEKFLRDVAKGRSKTVGEVRRVAGGRVWTGSDAVKKGLVDSLGGIEASVRKAKELARIEGRARLVLWPPSRKWYEELISAGGYNTSSRRRLDSLYSLLRSGKPLAMLPFFFYWD